MEVSKFNFEDLGGGLHDGLPATHIADRELAESFNFYGFGTKLLRREGVSRVTTSAYAENLSSVYALKQSTGSWTIIAGTLTGLAQLSGDQLVAIPNSDGVSIGSSTFPWDFHQYKNVGYALRSGVGLKRFDTAFWGSAGISPPTAAPTIADAGAGSVEAGDYYTVYTFYNYVTGAESNPSPKSTKLTHGAGTLIRWTNLQLSSNGQVNARRLYRTAPNQTGEYFFAVELRDNFGTDANDNVVLNDLGDTVSFDNGLPPSGLLVGAIWKERLFATDGTDLFFSEEGLPESFAADSIIRVFPDDGHRLRGLEPFGDRLLVGKTNATHFLVTSGPRAFALQTLSDRHGMASHYATKSAEGMVLWYTGTDFARSDGTNVDIISTTKVRKLLDRVPDAQKPYVSADIYPAKSLYLVTLPLDSSTNNKAVLAYNYKTDSWWPFDHPTDAPSFIAQLFDTNYGQKLYATFYDGHLYQYLSGTTDYGNAINARLKTKEWGFGKEGLFKALRRIFLNCSTVPRNITLRVFSAGTELRASRTVSLYQGKNWKLYNFSTLGNPEATVQLGLEYSGEDQIEIDALAIEVTQFMRSMRAA